jgi:hypothetical protein
MPTAPRWLGWTWVVAGGCGLVAATAVAAFGSAFVGSTARSATEALGVTEELLLTVGETATALDLSLAGIDEGLETAQTSVSDAAVTLTQVGRVTDDLGAVATDAIPASLDQLRDGMPQLIATAGVIDGAMRALRFVGVDYDPDAPLDDALRELESELADLPLELRDQAEAVAEVSEGISDFGGDALAIAGDIGLIQDRLTASREVVAGYPEVAEEGRRIIAEARERISAQAGIAKVTVLILGIAIAVGQTVPIAVGWWILRSGRPVPA